MRKGKNRPGYEHNNLHMIFEINIDGEFTINAWFVDDEYTATLPVSIAYPSVVSRESVRIVFILASLNYLEIFACDIGNSYINANYGEKLWTEVGTEFWT